MLTQIPIHAPNTQNPQSKIQAITATAHAFEAMFLSQMLQASGADKPLGEFGGGVGEAQFASFVTDAHAQALVANGGIGLAERLIRSLSTTGEMS